MRLAEFPKINTPQPILCYIKGPWAFFTTRKLEDQWGDDWNDAPYECNAYEFNEYDREEGKEPWEITKVAWDGPFNEPGGFGRQISCSVEQINAGEHPWLVGDEWSDSAKSIIIQAGTTLDEFCHLIRIGGGRVYTEQKEEQ